MQPNNLNEIKDNPKKILSYLKQKGSNHNYYKYYCDNYRRILAIRDNEELFLSKGTDWNDTCDSTNLNSPQTENIKFARCFSFSQEESVAMWMLYGGINKQGAMIDFTKKGIQSILQISQIEAGYFSNGSFVPLISLQKGEFALYVVDMLYYSEKENVISISRGDEIVHGVSKGALKKLKECSKVYPWRYENECRLIVSIPADKLDNECENIRIDLRGLDLGKSYQRIYIHPNFTEKDPDNVRYSSLKGSINWNLCSKCPLQNQGEKA